MSKVTGEKYRYNTAENEQISLFTRAGVSPSLLRISHATEIGAFPLQLRVSQIRLCAIIESCKSRYIC